MKWGSHHSAWYEDDEKDRLPEESDLETALAFAATCYAIAGIYVGLLAWLVLMGR